VKRRVALNRALVALVILVADDACSPSVALAYRTARDFPAVPDDQLVRWESPPQIYLDVESVPASLNTGDVEATLREALRAWRDPVCSRADAEYLGGSASRAAPADGTNTVEWIQGGWEARGFGADLPAVTDVQYATDDSGQWHIVEADVYLNATSHPWTLGARPDLSSWDVQSVLTHEFGHLLGLLHPCELDGTDGAPICDMLDEPKTMYPVYEGAEQATLAQDDIVGICALYPATECVAMTCPETSACTSGGCQEWCGGALCTSGQHCVDATCVEACPPEGCLPTGACVGDCSEFGDPCASERQCASGVCASTGFCTSTCLAGMTCPVGSTCAEGRCEADTRRPLGGPCATGAECLGAICLLRGGAPSCTRACEDDTPCPAGWACGEVDGRSVCAPARTSGCAVGAVRRASDASTVFVLCSMFPVLIRGRRRRGRS
jgi:hypothetical protein